MLRAGGYATVVDPSRPLVERDTCSCGHCQAVIFTKPGYGITTYLLPHPHLHGEWVETPGAFCRCCMKPVCLRCDSLGRCLPWEKQFAAVEARGRFLRSAGL